ncbi:GntR family transcriptional regulator [Microbacterium saperdae]|uniref:GntR family transcriptional regulator n=1 Tax=Microbacterium saperdae TaxID=69368 RepID=UPI0011525C41|nr:GntR family transcriptional regulator [Microbacterium saperdae]
MIVHDMENAIIDGEVSEDALAPSASVLARRYGVNIATTARALRVLQDRGIVRRLPGIGMYILAGCRAALLAKRRDGFADRHLEPLVDEARRLGMSNGDVTAMCAARLHAHEGGTTDAAASVGQDDANER